MTGPLDSPGIILDASAIVALPGNMYAQALVRVFAKTNRPIIIPVLALTAAALTGRIRPAVFDDHAFTVAALTQPMIPDLVEIITSSAVPLALDAAHAAYLATHGGSVLITADGTPYRGLRTPVWIDELAIG